MSRSHILAVAGCALLAACGKPADTAPDAATAAAIPPAILPPVIIPPAAQPPAAPPVPVITYKCDPETSLQVKYDNAAGADGQALVTLNGKAFTLDHAASGSGVRYETKTGLAPGATLIWWNKGRGGTLLEGVAVNPEAPEKTLATCTEAGAK